MVQVQEKRGSYCSGGWAGTAILPNRGGILPASLRDSTKLRPKFYQLFIYFYQIRIILPNHRLILPTFFIILPASPAGKLKKPPAQVRRRCPEGRN
ncbi:MAG: hypothetical protein EA344_04570 [Alkalicoccus sp.]|nr:MAG: hypothetical protein EA344_04570 [Alkalicoccus sp.]